jgi:predicted double-glycine peptidase
MLTSLVVALSLAVPYLPQTDALCGGAAAAMIFRYWGDVHADVEQFAPLVDRRAGGIADDVLVKAIEERGWRSLRFSGSVDQLNEQLHNGRPVVILVADRGGRNHYLVVTGIEPGAVLVHDPAWGPSRRVAFADLVRVWRPTHFWSLVILPSGARATSTSPTSTAEHKEYAENTCFACSGVSAAVGISAPGSECDRRLKDAIDEASPHAPDEAYQILDRVRTQCQARAGPLRELAGVRFAQHRWRDAADLAERAVARDGTDGYAWDVLASSRFLQDDFDGALGAWNHIGKPIINLVHIDGLAHTRYQTVATAIGLAPNMLLTENAFQLAARRLEELRDLGTARLTFRPEADGFVTVNVAVVERAGPPQGAAAWAAAVVQAAVDREARVAIPGSNGQGDLWSASWRWWNGRPRVAVDLAAPHGSAPRIWRVDASWESQAYATAANGPIDLALDESRLHGGLSLSDWLSAKIRYSVTGGLDSWRGGAYTGRTVFAGASLERRWLNDRWSLAGAGTAWIPVFGGSVFHEAGMRAAFRSARSADRWVYLADAGVERASDTAPLAIWPGAGDGHARDPLLRAHPLLNDGVIEPNSHSVFGRTLVYANAEAQRWFASAMPIHAGLAAFADIGGASRRRTPAQGGVTQVDLGAGIRLRIPGAAGTLRIDVARGLRDHADALTVGWQF